MNIQQHIDEANKIIDSLRQEYNDINIKMRDAINMRDMLLYELNKNRFDDIEWLIKNPNMPGVSDAVDAIFKKQYGGIYNGVLKAGYISNPEDDSPIQMNFDFTTTTYDSENEKEKLFKDNIRHFVDNYLQFLKPYMIIKSRWDKKFQPVEVVGFMFHSDECGLQCVGYDPVEKVWYHYEQVYGNPNTKQKFVNFEEALDFMFTYEHNNTNDD